MTVTGPHGIQETKMTLAYCKRQLSKSWGPRLFQNFHDYSGQIPIIPKPEFSGDFEGKALLNRAQLDPCL